jgi:hypothetical protein
VVDQRPDHRRARGLWPGWEAWRQAWVDGLGGHDERQVLLDTQPVPVVGQTRRQRRSDVAGAAAQGYWAARQLPDFGDQRVSVVTVAGLPVVDDWGPAHLDERAAAAAVVYRVQHCDSFADNGFLGQDWQAAVRCQSTHRMWTTKRINQAHPNPLAFDARLKRLRERLASTVNHLQNTGRFLARLLATTPHGLHTRVIAKVAALVLRFLLNKRLGIAVLSFSIVSDFNSH